LGYLFAILGFFVVVFLKIGRRSLCRANAERLSHPLNTVAHRDKASVSHIVGAREIGDLAIIS